VQGQFYDPRSSVSLREMIDRLLAEAVVSSRQRSTTGQAALAPPANVYETEADLVVIVAMPGVSPHEIEIDLVGDQLSVRTLTRRDVPHSDLGTQQAHIGHAGGDEGGRRYYQHELQIGPYARVIDLPYAPDAEPEQASYEHGLLALRFPRPDRRRTRRIDIRAGQQPQTPAPAAAPAAEPAPPPAPAARAPARRRATTTRQPGTRKK